MSNRYTVPLSEDTEPGSNDEVLKNYLHITSKEQIEALEEQELNRTFSEIIQIYDEDRKFTVLDICKMHELWLGDIYPSAGKYRSVMMSKNGFPFAFPSRIPVLMEKFEQELLARYTPCHNTDIDELAFILGLVHVEFILIHPFREGNGRIGRLLISLMVIQAGRPPINFSYIDQTIHPKGYSEYIKAVQIGHASSNYEPMKKIFKILLEDST